MRQHVIDGGNYATWALRTLREEANPRALGDDSSPMPADPSPGGDLPVDPPGLANPIGKATGNFFGSLGQEYPRVQVRA